jgi:dTMP kinase
LPSRTLAELLLWACRQDYGSERYEKLDFQKKVASEFKALEDERFYVIDASRTVEEVQADVQAAASEVLRRQQDTQAPLGLLWGSRDAGA